MDEKELEAYCQFLRVVNKRINEHFEDQKEFICCKEGCAQCCKNAQYPCSKLEFEFLKIGFISLPLEQQKIIISNIEKIKNEVKEHKEGKFTYTCPFLINDRCSVYNFRMIICRTFGLAYYEESNSLSSKKKEELHYKNEPVAYNLDMKNLKKKFGKDIMHLDFGEEKALIDWLLE